MKRGNQEVREMWERSSRRDPARRRTSYTSHKRLLRSLPEQRRPPWPAVRGCRRAFSCLRPEPLAGRCSGSRCRLHPRGNQALRGTKAFHATKDCSGFTGLVGAYLHDQVLERQGNQGGLEDLLRPGRRARPRWTATSAIYVRRGSVATGHCLLASRPGSDCARSRTARERSPDSTARVRVTADSSIPELWHWDGTYSFNQG